QNPIRSSQALARFRAEGQKPTELRVALVLGEAARGPVRLGRVAAARAGQRGGGFEREQGGGVWLGGRDLVDGAVGGQDALVVVAAEHGDLDLLALVLARVVLHASERTARLRSSRAVLKRSTGRRWTLRGTRRARAAEHGRGRRSGAS